ncbi:hypothetical protein [Klebsiella aerogenes]|uniref:hypothetical protein n=1 Tax=Klebsiella aerogenes TaxID=548 RepID=UPI0039C3969F
MSNSSYESFFINFNKTGKPSASVFSYHENQLEEGGVEFHKNIFLDNTPVIKNKTSGKTETRPLYAKNIAEIALIEIESLVSQVYSSFVYDDIQFGCDSKTQKMIEELVGVYHYDFIDNVLVRILSKHIVFCGKPVLMSKYMMLLSAFDANHFPLTCNMAITSLASKKFNSVKESVLISIETWKYKDAITLLEDMEPYNRRYLEDYKRKVIDFLKRC